MRRQYDEKLEQLHGQLILMSALCEDAISGAVKAFLEGDDAFQAQADRIEDEINGKEAEIEDLCVRLLLREQPVAGDLRRITAAQRMIVDMERIGDQAYDITEIARYLKGSGVSRDLHIGEMASAAIRMLGDSIDSFVREDLELAHTVLRSDDIVDDLFDRVRGELVALIQSGGEDGGACLDLLLIAKYLERIGDHSENIAEWVIYSITGERVGV